jgi:50S ribosomal protein L16 3-hydroxylase
MKPGLFSTGQCTGALTTDDFLATYWQKKPLLIRQAFPNFEPDLDADDIAGLACDELAEARLVTGSYPDHDWKLRHGPFAESDFSQLPADNWTLLVQDVEKHYPPLQDLVKRFSFLPSWRIDDLMVSVAGPGGSVGPHVDQYDVFLLQATGTRHWQIAESFDRELLTDCELNVLRTFDPEQEWELQPGDMLYLPPGIAHHGVALNPGMTWSLGMRAPSQADILLALGEWLAGSRNEGERYSDSGIQPVERSGEINAEAIRMFRELCASVNQSEKMFPEFLGAFLSAYRLAHQPAPPADASSPADLGKALKKGAVLRHNPWTRLLWLELSGTAMIFAAGSSTVCSVNTAINICDPSRLEKAADEFTEDELSLCRQLLNQGHLYLD